MKDKFDLKKAADLLLEHGTEKPSMWMQVEEYREGYSSYCSKCGSAGNFTARAVHHTDETNFLFGLIGELKERHERLLMQYQSAIDELNWSDEF
jgi:hypothetical protein